MFRENNCHVAHSFGYAFLLVPSVLLVVTLLAVPVTGGLGGSMEGQALSVGTASVGDGSGNNWTVAESGAPGADERGGADSRQPFAVGGSIGRDVGGSQDSEGAVFDVSILRTNAPVAEGEQLEVTVRIENTGDAAGTQTIEVDGEGLGSTTTTVSLDAGEVTAAMVSFSTTSGDAGSYTITATSDDDTGVESIQVTEGATFAVDIVGLYEPLEGEDLEVTFEVRNTGGTADTQTIRVVADTLGTEREQVSLGSGESVTATVRFSTDDGDAGSYTVRVVSDDDADSRDVSVSRPATFEVNVLDVNDPVEGEDLGVTVEVENTGDESDTQSVEVDAGSVGSQTLSVPLGAGDSLTETVAISTADGDAGSYSVSVTSADDSDSIPFDVLARGTFAVGITEVTEPEAGGDLAVTVAVENTGDVSATQLLEVDGGALGTEQREITLDGGESTTVPIVFETDTSQHGEFTITATGDDDSDTVSATVSDPDPADGEENGNDGGSDGSDSQDDPGDTDGTSSGEGEGSGEDDESSGVDDGAPDGGDEEASDGDSTLPGLVAPVLVGGLIVFAGGAYALVYWGGDDEDDGADRDRRERQPVDGGGRDTGRDGTVAANSDRGRPTGRSSPRQRQRSNSNRGSAHGGRSSRSSGVGHTSSKGEGPTGADERVSIPSEIPGTPDRSLSYDDIVEREPIGSGGNADVYRGVVRTAGSTVEVAVKEPYFDGTLSVEAVNRLVGEAETWQKLDQHDHIVDIVDVGSEPLPWIAMEYMDAGHLGDRAGNLPTGQALWVAEVTTEALRYAHTRGIAHLDLKPENILFRSTEDGWDVPKVADWGLSKHLLDHSQTVDGITPTHAAPEQFDDEHGEIDHVTDIYQLGTVFYTLFTGRPPFEGQPLELIRKIETEEPTPPSQLADVPTELDEILLTAMATDRADRYESVIYLRDEFRDLQASLSDR